MASELIERDLYNGTFHMIHNPNARGSAPRYKVLQDGVTTKPKGVTTILGKVLAKDFVGWALDCMADCLTPKLPLITADDIAHAKLESTRRRDSGAGTGSEAHAMVERYLKGVPQVGIASPEADNAYRAFVAWFEEVKPNMVNVEEVIYSKNYGYAGTYDCILEIDGKNYLCDLKTTNTSRSAPNGIYAEYFIQLGAYAQAHEEQRVWEEENGGTKLVELHDLMVISAKKNGKLDIMTASDLGLEVHECADMFKRVVSLFNFLTSVTKQLGGR